MSPSFEKNIGQPELKPEPKKEELKKEKKKGVPGYLEELAKRYQAERLRRQKISALQNIAEIDIYITKLLDPEIPLSEKKVGYEETMRVYNKINKVDLEELERLKKVFEKIHEKSRSEIEGKEKIISEITGISVKIEKKIKELGQLNKITPIEKNENNK